VSPAVTGARPRLLLPEPDRLWIRYAPRAREWKDVAPPGELRWLDLGEGELAEGGAGSDPGPLPLRPLVMGPFDDVLYLPPVAPPFAAARDEAARSHAAGGTPVLVQVLAGEEGAETEPERAAGVVVVHDLLEALLGGKMVHPGGFEPGLRPGLGDVALWPLIPGLTDGADLVEEGCRRLAAAGFRTVHGVAPSLPPAQRRQLYERIAPPESEESEESEGDDLFQALFHGPGADPRAFARAAHRHGLSPFLPRPLPRPPLAGAPEREIAGLLALAGELSFRLGRPGRGQAHLRAARFLDRTTYDLRVLAREGNLPVLHWLGDESRAIVEEWAESGKSIRVLEISKEYLGPKSSSLEGTKSSFD
jgi:hypothetical protein